MRIIDADAYLEKARYEAKGMPTEKGEDFVAYTEWLIGKTPTIEPKQGEWKEIGNCYDVDGTHYYTCSVCGGDVATSELYNFCPNCGADMRERKGNEID